MAYPKFIVLKDFQNSIEIRFGFVEFHSDLIKEDDKKHGKSCIGGGLFEIVDHIKEIWLYGSSTDFGSVDKRILDKIKLTKDNISTLENIEKDNLQADIDYFKRVKKDLSKYKLVIKNF